jgi:hypothetical protein
VRPSANNVSISQGSINHASGDQHRSSLSSAVAVETSKAQTLVNSSPNSRVINAAAVNTSGSSKGPSEH